MRDFSELIDKLLLTSSRNRKIDILRDYFKNTADPDRGFTLAIITNSLELKNIPISKIKEIVRDSVDAELFALSYDYVGDLAETISLIWPLKQNGNLPKISKMIGVLQNINKSELKEKIQNYLSIANETERWALIKLISGGLRIGVSSRLAKTALAKFGNKELNDIEKIWHGIEPPYENLFKWLGDLGPLPEIDLKNTFNPMMLANPLEDKDFINLNYDNFVAEWKWDGIRVQIIINDTNIKIFSRTGDDISLSFPEIKSLEKNMVILDGELLVGRNYIPMNFNSLQKRLNRKKVSLKHIDDFPAFVKLYDILYLKNDDLREKNWEERRNLLENWYYKNKNEFFDLSKIINFNSWKNLTAIRKNEIIDEQHEGLMIKRKSSPYISGRPKGHWYKWKKDPKTVDAILMQIIFI